MIQIAMLLYGLYALIVGKFALGKGKVVRGARARILGALCWANFAVAFIIGFVWAVMAETGAASPPEGVSLTIIEFGLVLINLFVVFMIGNNMYTRQELENEAADRLTPAYSGSYTSSSGGVAPTLADPDNPFASPTRES